MAIALSYDLEDFDVLYNDELIDPAESSDSEPVRTPQDAFVLSINQFGSINLPYMAEISSYEEEDLVRELEGTLMWKDPACYDPAKPYEGWITREQYVRGNIFRLLEKAEAADRETGLYSANLALLRSELPDGPEQNEIMVSLGSTWVPAEVYLRFICELLSMEEDPPELYLDDFLGKWVLKGGYTFNSERFFHIYGTLCMNALRIIEHTMNATPIQIMDYYEDRYSGKRKSVLNKAETMAAREKQEVIIRTFQRWLAKHPKIMTELQEIYTDQYGYQQCRYDGSFLQLPGLNPDIRLYRHQRSAIARIVLSPNNVLLSHDVGAGKTYEFVIGIHERLRMGLSRKAMLVVPNAVFQSTIDTIRLLYPDDEFCAITTADFTPARRGRMILKIMNDRAGWYVIAASSFDMLGLSKEYRLQEKRLQIAECVREIEKSRGTSREQTLLSQHKKLVKEYNEIYEKQQLFIMNSFDEFNIDLLVVDECHNYKNITLAGSMEPIAGMHTKGSKKADLMLAKCDAVRKAGGKLVFATGTPLTNSMADLFVLQRFLQPEELEFLHIARFPEWVQTFATRHSNFEIDSTATSFRFVTRFDRFHNLPELMALFGNVCDYYRLDQSELDLPEFHGYKNITIPRSDDQEKYIQNIVERTEAIREHQVSPKEDNYLKITSDGKKCALDIRLVLPELAGSPIADLTKADSAAATIAQVYRDHPGMTQVVFCDLSTPGKGFHLYGEIRRLLVEEGIPEEEIAFIHSASTDAARKKLIRRFNAGEVRILLGSTPKIGLGVNIQQKLLAVHHIDVPWRPSDMVQREGRAIRQGNENPEVLIFRYVTEQSFDAYTWQILENKQRFITSFLSGSLDRSHRSEQDIGETLLDYAEIKALAIGNPLIRKRVEVANRLGKTRAKAVRRREELIAYQKALSEVPGECRLLQAQIDAASKDLAMFRSHKKKIRKEQRERLGVDIIRALAGDSDAIRRVEKSWYRGFKVLVPSAQDPEHPVLVLKNQPEIEYHVDMKDAKIRGCCTRLDNVLESIPERMKTMQSRLSGLRGSLLDVEEQIRKGNPYDEKIRKLAKQLDTIDAKLKEEIEA